MRAAFERLLGADVIVEDDRPSDESAPLSEAEAAIVARAVESRRQEFGVGRACARRALGRLGIAVHTIGSHPERDPVWPDGVVGSITHTVDSSGRLRCAVAVASATVAAGIGIDAEPATPLDAELMTLVCRPGEVAPGDAEAAKIVFCAKEALYKAIFPLTRRFLEFSDVETMVSLPTGTFLARAVTDAGGPRFPEGHSVEGGVVVFDGLVLASLRLPPGF